MSSCTLLRLNVQEMAKAIINGAEAEVVSFGDIGQR